MPDAFILGEKFIGKDNVALILGDNFFYGQSLTKKLKECTKLKKGAKVFIHPVKNPSLYGVVKLNKKNKIINMVEKPKKFYSDYAITGLYYFDNKVTKYAKSLKPSSRKLSALPWSTKNSGNRWPSSINETASYFRHSSFFCPKYFSNAGIDQFAVVG